MPTKSKVNPFLIIAPEIWSEIFQNATFIPGEWDVVGTRIDIGVSAHPSNMKLSFHFDDPSSEYVACGTKLGRSSYMHPSMNIAIPKNRSMDLLHLHT